MGASRGQELCEPHLNEPDGDKQKIMVYSNLQNITITSSWEWCEES